MTGSALSLTVRFQRWAGFYPLALPFFAASAILFIYGICASALVDEAQVAILTSAAGAPLAALSIFATYRGIRMINADAKMFQLESLKAIVDDALKRLGPQFGESSMEIFAYGWGKTWWIRPALKIDVGLMFVEEHSLGVCEGGQIDLRERGYRVSTGVRQIRYEQVTSVETKEHTVEINLTSSKPVILGISTSPTDRVRRLQERLQRIHTSSAVTREVVERQIVVVRCAHCGELTPVDQPRCKNCGAGIPA